MKRTLRTCMAVALAATVLAACGNDDDSGGNGGGGAAAARGPIKVWYSNNPIEIAWAKQMIKAWNADHPDEKVTGQEIPSAKSSEEVITAAITAGTTPCLIFNGAQIATPDYVHMGGLVDLDEFPGATDYIEARSGADVAEAYKSPDGKYYQVPWKSNPVMVFYNKDVFAKAGLDPNSPQLSTYDEFLDAARAVVAKGGVDVAIAPSPTSEFYQSFFDFYPLFSAETGGTEFVEDGQAQFDSDAGLRVADFWKTLYDEGLAPKEPYSVDPFAEKKSAMAIVGPWAISSYKDAVDWGVVPVPTSDGTAADQTWTFADAKTISVYSSCDSQGTAWDVLKFATSKEQDGKLLEMTGQMPMRQDLPETYSDYFASHPDYKTFADQSARAIEVPYIANSIESWQKFRDAYTASVIFGKQDVDSAFSKAADEVNGLASGS
jgi:multiple sugar transport system substrate-binding protein